jgi:hypothetical protein
MKNTKNPTATSSLAKGYDNKIYLYKDVLISSNFSYYDGRYAQIDVYL